MQSWRQCFVNMKRGLRRQAVRCMWRHFLWKRMLRNQTVKNNIDAVSTEDAKKASSENMEAMRTEDDSKYTSSDNMVHV